MSGYRPQRIAEMIHRELSVRLRQALKDPAFPPISITHVEVTRDLRHARVMWSPLGGGQPSEELVDAIDLAARQLRGPIGRALRTRNAPELHFELDQHTEDAVRMTTLLGEIGRELAARDALEEGEE
jgi:ribosome-binding factor A